MGPGPGRLVRLTGAVITSSDEVNIALFFAAMGSVWSNSKSGDYLQERTTIQIIHGMNFPRRNPCKPNPSQATRRDQLATNLHSTQNGGLGILSDIAFHEKAGRSQEVFFCRVAAVAILPSAVVDELFARCKLGVLVSAGAAT